MKSLSYGRFGFCISQGDGGKGPWTVGCGTLEGGRGKEVLLELTETQGLLLLADLAEFSAKVLSAYVEKQVYYLEAMPIHS